MYPFDTDVTALVYFKTAIVRCYVALFDRTAKKLSVTTVTTPWVIVVKCWSSSSWHSGALVSTVMLMMMLMMTMMMILINKTYITP